MSAGAVSDEDKISLALQAQAGDRDSMLKLLGVFDPLMHLYSKILINHGIPRLDAIQEVRLMTMRAIMRFDTRFNVQLITHVMGTIQNNCKTYIKSMYYNNRKIHTKRFFGWHEIGGSGDAESVHGDDVFSNNDDEIFQLIASADLLENLNLIERHVCWLTFQGLKGKEIAFRLGRTVKRIKYIKAQIITKVSRRLE